MSTIIYTPGVCNIGPEEIKQRNRAGIIGLVLTVLGAILLFATGAAKVYRLVLFLPAVLAAVGFLQARMQFCAHFGLAGLFNFGDLGKTSEVKDIDARKKDRRKSVMIIAYAVLIAAALALIAYYI